MVNIGNGYHNNTGVFIVPTSGVYVFSWSVRLRAGAVHSVELVVNNESHGLVSLWMLLTLTDMLVPEALLIYNREMTCIFG